MVRQNGDSAGAVEFWSFSPIGWSFPIGHANYVGRMMPSFFILASRVVGFNPKISAAPPLPRMRQFVACSTL